MDALDVLRQMHDEAMAEFRRIEQSSPSDRGPIWAKLMPTLKLHEQVEERFVYDPVTQDGGSQHATLQQWHQMHEQQVSQVDGMMSEIGKAEPSSPTWLQQVQTLRSTLEQHIAWEEGQIFPRIAQVWDSSRREKAGKEIEAAKAVGSAGANMSQAGATIVEGAKQTFRAA